MSELDSQTKAWLQSLKLNKKLTKVSDFQNGYYFGLIFERLQLSRGKKFSNNFDLGCVFQNFKNVKDLLLQNFNCEFPVNNIIYRSQQLLKVVKQQTQKHIQQKKQSMLKAASLISNKSLPSPQQQKKYQPKSVQINVHQNINLKLPKKIQDIEKKLQKYRQQKTKHQLFALQAQKLQIEQYRTMVQNNRTMEINKTQKLHNNTKQLENKVYKFWQKTQQIKKQRISTDKALQNFQKQKHTKLIHTLQHQQRSTFDKGLQIFQLNCMRQGIELQHDPDKPPKTQSSFNKVVVLQKIKDNIIKNQKDKKQRVKRQNIKNIDAHQAKIKSQQIWNQNYKIQSYSKKIQNHFQLCTQTHAIETRLQGEKLTRKFKYSKKVFVQLPSFGNQQQRQQQFNRQRILYLFEDVKRIQKKYNQRYNIASSVVQALLHITIQTYQLFQQNGGFTFTQWKAIEQQFLDFEDHRQDKIKDDHLYMDFSQFNQQLKHYLKTQQSWKIFHHQSIQQNHLTNNLLISTISTIINKVHPNNQLPSIEKPPLYMPLKLSFCGPRLTGKSYLSAKLAQKYGLLIINPLQIIKEAIDLAKPPVQQQPKKGAKKDNKKVQQPTPQKIALKQFGLKLLQSITSVKEAQIPQICSAIKFKITQNFKQKTDQQQIQQYLQSKQKQKQRHQQALKQFQDLQKKPKKDVKKGAQPIIEQPPKPNQCFYTSGFVLDDFPINQSTLKSLQRQLNGYLTYEQRINQNGTKIRQILSNLIFIPQPPKDTSLQSATLDFLFSLSSNTNQLFKRRIGRKIDPQTKQIYHPTFNPIPTIKGFAQKLIELPILEQQDISQSVEKFSNQQIAIQQFYSLFGIQSIKLQSYQQIDEGQENIQKTISLITQKIQPLLKQKYVIIQQKIANLNTKQKQQQKQPNTNQQVLPTNDNKQNVKQQTSQNKQITVTVTQNNENKSIIPATQNNQITVPQLVANNLSKQFSEQLLNKYKTIVSKFQQGIKQCLYKLSTQRTVFTKQLLSIQKNFTNLINRPDDKAGKILQFQQNYNKLLSEQSNIVKDVQASKHLIQKLNQLYNSLWDSIGNKKNQSVIQRQLFQNSDWINIQAEKIVQVGKCFMQVQLNYLCETIFFILSLCNNLQNKPSLHSNEYLLLGISPTLQVIPSITPNDFLQNQRFSYYTQQLDKCLASLDSWIERNYLLTIEKQKKNKIQILPSIKQLLNQFVTFSINNIKCKVNSLRNKINQRILEQRSYHQTLVNKMDDWIIHGIKSQNDFVYAIYKNIKKCIEQAKRSNVKELHVRQITQIFYPIRQLPLHPIPLRLTTTTKNLPIYSFMIFLQQIKTLSNNEGKIMFQIFKKYMDKRKKSALLHPLILAIDYDKIQQYLVKQNYLYLKQLALAVILWDVNVLDDQKLSQYKAKLLKTQPSPQQLQFRIKTSNSYFKNSQQVAQEQKQQKHQQHNQQKQQNQAENKQLQDSIPNNSSLSIKRQTLISSFPTVKKLAIQQLILMQQTFDEQQEYIIKHIIFEIYRQNGMDYLAIQNLLDTLSLFDQLQVLRYGDAVMIVNR